MILEIHDEEIGNTLLGVVRNIDYEYQAEEYVKETFERPQAQRWVLFSDDGTPIRAWQRDGAKTKSVDATGCQLDRKHRRLHFTTSPPEFARFVKSVATTSRPPFTLVTAVFGVKRLRMKSAKVVGGDLHVTLRTTPWDDEIPENEVLDDNVEENATRDAAALPVHWPKPWVGPIPPHVTLIVHLHLPMTSRFEGETNDHRYSTISASTGRYNMEVLFVDTNENEALHGEVGVERDPAMPPSYREEFMSPEISGAISKLREIACLLRNEPGTLEGTFIINSDDAMELEQIADRMERSWESGHAEQVEQGLAVPTEVQDK